MLKSRPPCSRFSSGIAAGDRVFAYYNTSKQNEAKEWVSGRVSSVHDNFIEVRRDDRAQKGRPMRVAYEDIRLRPQYRSWLMSSCNALLMGTLRMGGVSVTVQKMKTNNRIRNLLHRH